MIRQINKKLGISQLESPRVYLNWITRFFFQIGFVVAWTIVTALFVEQFGIQALLLLFLCDGVLYALGAFLASFLIPRISLRRFLFFNIVATSLLVGASLFFSPENILFFVCILAAKDLFFSQLSIALYRRSEHLFSPSEAQRFMPLVESAITVGAVVGATLMLIFLDIMPAQFVLFLWLAMLFGIGAVIFFTPQILHTLPRFSLPSQPKKDFPNPLKEAIHGLQRIPFLRHIAVILLLQTAVFTIVEFEFTKDVQSHIVPHHEITSHIQPQHLQASLFQETKETLGKIGSTIKHNVEEISSGFIMHKTLAHDLGAFHLLFGLLALVVQFFTPKLLQKFGVIGTMFSYFLILSVTFLSFLLGYGTVNTVRMIQHGTHSLGEAPYHLTFYSIFSHGRESVRLFLEGIIRPIGILLAVISFFLFPSNIVFWFALAACGGLLILSWPLKKSFTALSEANLDSDDEIEGKLHSIEVLGQRGHTDRGLLLSQELQKKELPPVIRQKIIRTLTVVNDPRSIHTYLEILRDKKEDFEIKMAVLDSLFHIKISESYWQDHAFTRYNLLEILKSLFSVHEHSHMRKLIVMNIFRHQPSHEIAPFFLETMNRADVKLQSVYLRSCQMFDDPAIAFYVRDYLDHSDPRIQGHAIIALWKFHDRQKLQTLLDQLLEGTKDEKISALYTIGEVKARCYRDNLYRLMHDEDHWIQLHALIALAKINDEHCIPGLLRILFGSDRSLSKAAFHMLDRAPQEIRDTLTREIRFEVSNRVAHILRPQQIYSSQKLSSLPQNILEELKHLYALADRYDDILVMEHLRG
ncbi:hypothetical protein K9M59_02885 [Candidatus Gracilibacteria bacterium]|nr:hypothetical protein [Candidatus Gracilibacteria bacterium]MCF7819277.1 hypothetical protein [Candidatus Gracilibacteria bacterium]